MKLFSYYTTLMFPVNLLIQQWYWTGICISAWDSKRWIGSQQMKQRSMTMCHASDVIQKLL